MELLLAVICLAVLGAALLCLCVVAFATAAGQAIRWLLAAASRRAPELRRRHLSRVG